MCSKMTNPSDQSTPTLDAKTTPAQSVHIWIDLMKSVDRLVMAGFVRQYGLEEAKVRYREWFAERTSEHGEHMAKLASRLNRIPEDD